MATLRNSFDGGTSAAVITTANSGGLSGDALSFVVNSPTYASSPVHAGALAANLPSGVFSAIGYNLAASQVWLRLYFQTNSSAANVTLASVYNTAGGLGTVLGTIELTSAAALQLRCGAGSSTITGPLTMNAWMRIEARWSTTTGADMQLYTSPESGTPAGSVTVATNLASAAASLDIEHSGASLSSYFVDDFAVSSDGPLGPLLNLAPRPPMMSTTAVHRASRY